MNFKYAALDLINPEASRGSDKANVTRDLKPYEGEMPKLEPGDDRRREVRVY